MTVAGIDYTDMTVPGIDYTVISTTRGRRHADALRRLPHGPRVTNVTLQDQCPRNRATHLTIPYDKLVPARVEHALDPAGAPRPSR